MSTAIDQAEDPRKRAIEILLIERTAIDERLAMLSYDTAAAPSTSSAKRRACGICGSADHNARRCSKTGPDASPLDANL